MNHPQPTPEQLALLAAALVRREILDLYQQSDELWIVDTGTSANAWWEFSINFTTASG
ncbi:hypothetical protein [Tolypothrix sp. VBCCA 56010]|uniref:hypothetical protein n=1 Tax=Tolypothrix sp. VBCCA 56010 TaxID=3137731 RepID=UPI003D7F15F0